MGMKILFLKEKCLLFAIGILISFSDNPVTVGQLHDFQSIWDHGLEASEVEAGWISLFDGKSFSGWRDESNSKWQIKNGSFVGEGQIDSLLRTAVQFDDFELRLKFRSAENTSCEFFARTSPAPQDLNRGSFAVLFETDEQSKQKWNELCISADQANVFAKINDAPIMIVGNPGDLRKGYFGFKLGKGQLEIRDVFLLPKNLNSLLSKNLDKWNQDKKLESRFELENGTLQMKGGRGQIETNTKFGDFVFSMHAKTNSKGLNSGVFFRCIENDLMNGYESQIQNLFKNDDRTIPVDCGTGGIFRRQNAKFINADDQAWFSKTIVADGATICVWVNGAIVTDWTDKRVKNDNPRKGLRLKPGTIILQGHDPTTDLSFKNIKVRELNSRSQ